VEKPKLLIGIIDMGIRDFMGSLSKSLGELNPQQRAMLLRTAAGTTKRASMQNAFMAQADDITKAEEQRKLLAMRQQENQAAQLNSDRSYGLRERKYDYAINQDQLERENQRAALLDQQAGFQDIKAYSEASTPEEKAMVVHSSTSKYFNEWYAKVAAKRPLVEVNTGDLNPWTDKIPTGYMPVDVNDPESGIRPMPGSNADTLNTGDAARTQAVLSGRALIPVIEEKLFTKKEDGTREINQLNVINGYFNTPWTEGRTLGAAYEQGIQAITRGETGAAMPPEEVENTKKRFQPMPGDSDELKKIKFEMFKDFLNGQLNLVILGYSATGGSREPFFDGAGFDAELQRRLKETGAEESNYEEW